MCNTVVTKLVLGLTSAVIVACTSPNSNDSKQQQSPQSIILKPDNESYSIPISLNAVQLAEPWYDFVATVRTPYSRNEFKNKSDYETLEDFTARFADFIKDTGDSQETPLVIYHVLGPLVGDGSNSETGAVSLSYSVEERTATFEYNPASLDRTVWVGPNPEHPDQYANHSLTMHDIDCIAKEPLERSARKLYLKRRSEVVPMDRETAERLEVLTKPKLLSLARIEYNLLDPRYTSVPVLNRLATDPIEFKNSFRNSNDAIASSFVYGPTQVITMITRYGGTEIRKVTHSTHIGDLTDVLIVDSESKNVLYKLPACSFDRE